MASIAAVVLAACGTVSNAPDAAATADSPSPQADAPQSVPFCDATDSNLVACYEFEPSSPPTALLDGSSSNNVGTLAGVSYVSGHAGMAIQVAPSTSRITVPDSTSLDVANVTVELWLKTDTLVAAGARAGLLDNEKQYGIFVKPGNTIECSIVTTASPATFLLDTTVAVNVGQWTHVACTYDGATSTGHVFLNGAPVAMGTGPGPTVSGADPNGTTIGANSPCAAAPCSDSFSGALDQLRIWKRARTPVEICTDAGKTGC